MKDHNNIIIVDDDAEDRQMIRESFNEAGVDQPCLWLEDLPSLSFILTESKSKENLPLLIVLDYIFPCGNGLDALLYIKSKPEFSSVPVIVFSDYLTPLIEREFMNNGVLLCTQKPERFDEVVNWARFVKKFAEVSEENMSYMA